MMKMEGIAAEVSQKLKSAIKAKLTELGAYVDDELSNYVMVMVTNRRSKTDMDRELQLFLGPNTSAFTSWLQTVWQKLEQVTITNSSIDKRKATDKKKKTKKSSKTSSDSEDDKKHKKKRKSSVTDSVNSHTRKKKLQPKETEGKKKDEESHARAESDSESDDQDENRKKPAKDVESANEEEDFLNIKEDFESEFLSDNEGSTSAIKNKTVSTTEIKKSQRPDADTTSKVILLKRPEDTVTSKESADKVKSSPEVASVSKTSEASRETKSSTIRKPLVRDHKTKSIKLKTRRHSPSPTNQSPRSRSKSPLQNKIIKLKRRASGSASGEEDEDFNAKIQRSRLKSVAANANSLKLAKRSRSRSRSPLMSTAGKKLRRTRESDSVLDARELINRKRAMSIVNEPVTKEKNELGVPKTTISGGKMVRIRNRESSKENCRTEDEDCVTAVDDVWPENGDLADDDRKLTIKSNTNGASSKLIISRNDGKRSVIAHSSTSTDSSSTGNRRVDLRGIKRTVYIDEEDATKRDEDVDDCDVHVETAIVDEQPEKKKKKINVDHLLKYIQPDKVVASTVVKLPKPPRPKTSPAQAASSTLIRKAMADAHKSTSLKDKRGALDSKAGRQKYHEKTAAHPEVIDDEIEADQKCEVVGDDDRLSIKSSGSGDERVNSNGDERENMDEAVEQDEYEPTMSVPQFVVTLTGLDSNMFPKDDVDDLVDDMLIEDLEADMADMEENKNNLKNQERCKYYPNCLVGDQCLYYHPTIPCKLFPNCKFGANCLYIHPKCKFDSMCTRYDCTFTHSAPKTVQSAPPRHAPPPPMMTAQACKFYYNCVNPVCPYQHPKICRFDRFCTNKNCTFSHTSLTHVSAVSKDKLKWSRPKDIDFKMQPDSEMSLE